MHVLHKLTFECLNHPMVIPAKKHSHASPGFQCTSFTVHVYRAGQSVVPIFSPPRNAEDQGMSLHWGRTLWFTVSLLQISPSLLFVYYKINRQVLEWNPDSIEFGGKKNSSGLLQGWNFRLSSYYFESQFLSRSLSLALSSNLTETHSLTREIFPRKGCSLHFEAVSGLEGGVIF